MVHICSEYYSAIKKNKILPSATTCVDLEGILLSDISQTEKDKCHIISLTCGIYKTKLTSKAEQKQTHRYREYFDGFQIRGDWKDR